MGDDVTPPGKGLMNGNRADRAVLVVLDSQRRLDAALDKLNDCLEASSGVPIAEMAADDSLVTSVADLADLVKSTRAHRPERRIRRAKTSG